MWKWLKPIHVFPFCSHVCAAPWKPMPWPVVGTLLLPCTCSLDWMFVTWEAELWAYRVNKVGVYSISSMHLVAAEFHSMSVFHVLTSCPFTKRHWRRHSNVSRSSPCNYFPYQRTSVKAWKGNLCCIPGTSLGFPLGITHTASKKQLRYTGVSKSSLTVVCMGKYIIQE